MMSLYKKRDIASNIFLAVRTDVWQEKVDRVAGDFNDNYWRRKPAPQQQLDSTIEEMFKNAKLPVPPGPPLWRPGGVPSEWSTQNFSQSG